jgi:PAP2 superfamily
MHQPIERTVVRDVMDEAEAHRSFLARLGRNLAAQDLFVAGYLFVLALAVLTARGAGRDTSLRLVAADIVGFAIGLVLTRGGVLRQGSFANALVYRLTVFLPVFLSYFELRWILPVVSPHSLDANLLALDIRLFGFEPALAWDRYVTPHTTEWFAFFYFGYFFLLTVHVLPMMFFGKNTARIAHFSLGIIGVVVVGHILYMLVPGWGPYHHLAGHFEHRLEGGFFWRLVLATVEGGGAQKDIFPSLHTALPTYFAIFSYMHRRALPFRYTWPFMTFACSQIILATMFLRWHYLIDICAGLTLATAAALVSHRIVAWEAGHRARRGVTPIFTRLEWPGAHGDDEPREEAAP